MLRPTSWPNTLVVLLSGVGVGVACAGCGSGPNGLSCASAGAAGASRTKQVRRAAIRRMAVAKVLRRGAGERPSPPGEAHAEVTSRTANSAPSPAHTPRMPQSWCNASSASGT